ncbi:MAG: RNA-binding protein [Firmicutes bacterium]|nr:RNA-binding protein [Bacillota bacterium]
MDRLKEHIIEGSAVKSKAGRDKGRYFIVTAVSEDYVWLSDGMLRKLEKPKKKKKKHVEPVAAKKLVEPGTLTNKSASALIKELYAADKN